MSQPLTAQVRSILEHGPHEPPIECLDKLRELVKAGDFMSIEFLCCFLSLVQYFLCQQKDEEDDTPPGPHIPDNDDGPQNVFGATKPQDLDKTYESACALAAELNCEVPMASNQALTGSIVNGVVDRIINSLIARLKEEGVDLIFDLLKRYMESTAK